MRKAKNWNDFIKWYEEQPKEYLLEIKEIISIAEKKREEFIKKWPKEELKNLKFDELATGFKSDKNIFADLSKDDFLMSIGASLSKSRIKYINEEPKVCFKTKGLARDSDFISNFDTEKIALDLFNKIEQFLRGDFGDSGNFFDGNHYSTILIKLACMYARDNDVFIPDNNISKKDGKEFIKPLLEETGIKLSTNHYKANHQILEIISKTDANLRNSWIFNILKYRFKEATSTKEELTTSSEIKENKDMKNLTSLNTILFGPPGTGKTYHSIIYTVNTINPDFGIEDREYTDYLEEFNKLKEDRQIVFTTFHQSYGYEEFIEGIKPIVVDGQVSYRVESGSFKSFCENAKLNLDKKFVFIIDEINRGNISKIFGELITLIEDTKRDGRQEAMDVRLVYSKDRFIVPQNVYILGTMNTADRSIAMMDTALRRRFEFIEMMPNTDDDSLLQGIQVGQIDILKMLQVMNKRIEVLYDREHTLGHAFFMPLKEGRNSFKTLSSIFKHKIIPLLQEYFYEDYEKIMAILGIDKENKGENRFISKKIVDDEFVNQFSEELITYQINDKAFLEEENYLSIYSHQSEVKGE